MGLVARARDARSEDTFVIGPDVVGALRQKAQLMRREWSDFRQPFPGRRQISEGQDSV